MISFQIEMIKHGQDDSGFAFILKLLETKEKKRILKAAKRSDPSCTREPQ